MGDASGGALDVDLEAAGNISETDELLGAHTDALPRRPAVAHGHSPPPLRCSAVRCLTLAALVGMSVALGFVVGSLWLRPMASEGRTDTVVAGGHAAGMDVASPQPAGSAAAGLEGGSGEPSDVGQPRVVDGSHSGESSGESTGSQTSGSSESDVSDQVSGTHASGSAPGPTSPVDEGSSSSDGAADSPSTKSQPAATASQSEENAHSVVYAPKVAGDSVAFAAIGDWGGAQHEKTISAVRSVGTIVLLAHSHPRCVVEHR